MSLKDYMRATRAKVDAHLDSIVPAAEEAPHPLYQAVRHSLFAGGKRLRPILAVGACELADGEAEAAMAAACSLEMVHTYSLIHDDLPIMDDDSFRRGKPTCHKVFGEAMAMLAGDALLTMAFETLSHVKPPEVAARLAAELGRAAGPRGMVGGQVRDLMAEGKPADIETVEAIHREKTTALIRAAARMGAISAEAGPNTLEAISRYGERIGLAFQIADDILDVTASSEELGKTAGKDIAEGKATYPSAVGLDESRRIAAGLIEEACSELEMFGEKGALFRELALFIVERTN